MSDNDKRLELLIMTGECAGKRFKVPESGLRLGRSSSNDLHILDEELSRNHCLFEIDDGKLFVVDLASANGTYVNSEQTGSEAKRLAAGDIVEVGNTAIKIVDKDTPASISQVPKMQDILPVFLAETPAAVPNSKPSQEKKPEPAPKVELKPKEPAPPPDPPAQPEVPQLSALPQPASQVDLGLGEGVRGADFVAGQSTEKAASQRSPIVNVLWGVVAFSLVSLIVTILLFPSNRQADGESAVSAPSTSAKVSEFRYEKVEANDSRIFRYEMTLDVDGMLRVVYDDVPGENRHIDKSVKLNDAAIARVGDIFASGSWYSLDKTYSGPSVADENALKYWRIRTIAGTRMHDVTVENTQEPKIFALIREALETFSKNELGVWALQYSKDKLIELSAASEKLGDEKWNERTVEYGNLSACVDAYKEAVFYLDTINPKPQDYAKLREKLDNATAALDERYREQRFLADKALNLSDWETAKKELAILMQIIPDREDERHIEAKAKLVDVEHRLSAGKSKKKRGEK